MACAIFKNIIRFLLISFFIILGSKVKACGWFELPETYRLALFKAELNGMAALRPFYYSANAYNSYLPDPEDNDASRNCLEWQKRVGTYVKLNDIYLILNEVALEQFEKLRQRNELAHYFEGNSFIKELVLPKNKALLEYLAFAKEMEYQNFARYRDVEHWNDNTVQKNSVKDYSFFLELLPSIGDKFLQKRYAFLLARYYFQISDYRKVSDIYATYFSISESSSIIDAWALFFNAMAVDMLGDHIRANYLYSLSFDRCDSKKFRIVQGYKRTPQAIERTLAFARNNKERSLILTMSLFNYPGRALDKLKKIASLEPGNKYMATLIMREINKLEDWILTPFFTQYSPSTFAFNDSIGFWDYINVRERNLKQDLVYLNEFKLFLQKLQSTADAGMQNYLSLALAHVCFLNDEITEGNNYLNHISPTLSASLLQQKYVDAALVFLKSGNIQSSAGKQKLYQWISFLHNITAEHKEANKTLYSLLLVMAGEYEKKGDYATSGLLFMKSDHYKKKFEEFTTDEEAWAGSNYYWLIGYFDRYARLKDIDNLLNILKKKEKSNFERFLCDQKLGSEDVYIELKGTLAFRNNQLQLAYQTFKLLPQDYWDRNYEFKSYLNENPFEPKGLTSKERNYSYYFNKTQFVKQLIDLTNEAAQNPEKRGKNYLMLGHAYFNCSYWGNSWMMACYGQGTYEKERDYNDFIFGSDYDRNKNLMSENYYHCKLAASLYAKVLEYSKSKEEKAMALLMLHVCDYRSFLFDTNYNYWEKERKRYKATAYLKEFAKTYADTKVFRDSFCPLLESFLGK